MIPIDDSEIIALFFRREERAIQALDEKYGNVCHKIAANILNNRQDAEECVNDAYLGAWNTIPPQNPHPLSAYICRIVRNLAITKYHANTALKRNSHYDAVLEELEDCLASPCTVERECSAQELSLLLDRFLATLDQQSRVIFLRRYWYCDPIADIGARLHISANNVSVRLSRIRGKLKKHLKKEGYDI